MTCGGANMKDTIYGNRLPRGTQVKKGWEPLLKCDPFRKFKSTVKAK
jgi:hypothetical protein